MKIDLQLTQFWIDTLGGGGGGWCRSNGGCLTASKNDVVVMCRWYSSNRWKYGNPGLGQRVALFPPSVLTSIPNLIDLRWSKSVSKTVLKSVNSYNYDNEHHNTRTSAHSDITIESTTMLTSIKYQSTSTPTIIIRQNASSHRIST